MDIRIQVIHAGEVCVAPAVPYGGEHAGIIATSGIFTRQDNRLWLPVSAYLIEHPQGMVLVDTGWSRAMSPQGRFDKEAQISCLGSWWLYRANQGVVDPGQTVAEQLASRDITPDQLACVLLTHLDCDHVGGLKSLAGAPRVLVAPEELDSIDKDFKSRIRYQPRWWDGIELETIEWNDVEGPFGKSFDLFGDGSIVCIAIPGHSDGLFAVKVTGDDGRFALLCSDGAFGERSWQETLLPGIGNDRAKQLTSLEWIREQSEDPLCVEVLATHDKSVEPHTVELLGPREIEVPDSVELPDDYNDLPDELRQNAGKIAVAAMLAATLSTTPVNYDDFLLPDATPIVQMVDMGGSDIPPAVVADDQQDDSKQSIWEKVINILKYALIALILVGSLAVAAINGCTSCATTVAIPATSSVSSEASQ